MKNSTKAALQAVIAGAIPGGAAGWLTENFPVFLLVTALAAAGAYSTLLRMKADQRTADRERER